MAGGNLPLGGLYYFSSDRPLPVAMARILDHTLGLGSS